MPVSTTACGQAQTILILKCYYSRMTRSPAVTDKSLDELAIYKMHCIQYVCIYIKIL